MVVDVWLPSLWEGEDLEFHIILVLPLQASKQTKQQNKTKEKKPKKNTIKNLGTCYYAVLNRCRELLSSMKHLPEAVEFPNRLK